MGVPSAAPFQSKRTRAIGIPTIDMSRVEEERSVLADQIVRACQDYGFFKLVNHGVPQEVISQMEQESFRFFGKGASEKQRVGPPTPFGYGCKTIGLNGDMGELEYLLLHTHPSSISHTSKSLPTHHPLNFSCAANDYVEAVRKVACEILDLVAEGLWVPDKSVLSGLIRDAHSDSCFRLNHYPPTTAKNPGPTPRVEVEEDLMSSSRSSIGFGEHTDPQILTILRSNDVGGLQICMPDGLWLPVPPDPTHFFVFVGDALQALTNGRFVSVRHRVLANTYHKARMSMMYFGAPPLNALLSPLPHLVSPHNPTLYNPFTWEEYKKAAYCLRLGDSRLDLFKAHK